ncbi:MAG TPA: CBS domain-containing protein [Methylomirabilota bacterium]|nr:CBS domain-containing protein [Methylomirabilota bacterium]
MIVADLMTRTVITVSPETPVLDARQEMLKQKIRHLPVIASGPELLGIVTDRDIRLSLPSQATSLSVWELNFLLTKLTVEKVMTRTVITVGPERPAPDAARLMLDHKIGALPVMDGGRLVGIVTETDMLRAFVHMATPELARRT